MGRAWQLAIAALALTGSAVPAGAYSTRYEVRHYPAAFTRTVNGALGSNTESYADGSVAIGFGTTPALSLSVVVTQLGSVGFDIDASYQFAVKVAPTTTAAQAFLVALGQHPSHVKLAEATGLITLTATKAFGSRTNAYVGQTGYDFSAECDDGSGHGCGTTPYHTALFLDAAAANPYLCARMVCPAVAFGTAITLQYSMIGHVQVFGGPGSHASLLIDPIIALDSDTLHGFGLSSRDFTLTPEAGFGNVAGVPEPSAWALLVAGFGLVGIVRRRPQVVAA